MEKPKEIKIGQVWRWHGGYAPWNTNFTITEKHYISGESVGWKVKRHDVIGSKYDWFQFRKFKEADFEFISEPAEPKKKTKTTVCACHKELERVQTELNKLEAKYEELQNKHHNLWQKTVQPSWILQVTGEYSVAQTFIDDTNDYEVRFVDADTAVKKFNHLIASVGARLGTTRRVIVTDGDDFCNMEWKFGQGITYPPELVKQ